MRPGARNFSSPGTAAALGSIFACVLTGCALPPGAPISQSEVGAALRQQEYPGLRPAGSPTAAQLPPGVALEAGVTEENAVAIALWNNALFQENLSKLGFARGDLVQAGMLANPTLSMLFPIGPKQLEFTATLPLEALWLRPKRVAIANLEAGRVAQGLVQSGLDLIRDVKVSVSDLRLAMDRAAIAGEALGIRAQVQEIAGNRQRVGEGSELETMAARVESEQAREEAARLQRETALARERLSLLLGWPLRDSDAICAASPPRLSGSLSAADLESRALSARPDLRAAELALEAAGRKAGLAEAEVFTLSGVIDANAQGKEGFEIGPGFALPLPIFNRNQAAQIRATAELERAGWNYLGLRQRIVAEVRDAVLRVEQAAAALASYETRVMPPLEELERATRRGYELGEISPLAVQENSRQWLLLQVRRAELRSDWRRAWADLERNVGARVPPASSQPPNVP